LRGLVVFVHEVVLIAEVILVNCDITELVCDGLLSGSLEFFQKLFAGS
jgi:hypothetical protein